MLKPTLVRICPIVDLGADVRTGPSPGVPEFSAEFQCAQTNGKTVAWVVDEMLVCCLCRHFEIVNEVVAEMPRTTGTEKI